MDPEGNGKPGDSAGRRHRAMGVVSLAVMGSRALGLVREVVFAAMFGASRKGYLDSLLAAFQIPNLLRDLFAEGALSTAFTAVFTKMHEREGAQPAWRLASLLLSTVVVIGGGVCLLGIAASPAIVQVTSFGFHDVPGKFEMTVRLTRILFPFILFVSLAAVVMGILNARFVFGVPASASTAFNLVSVIAGVGLAFAFDPQADWRHPVFTERALYGVALGVLLGGLAQLGMQLPSLWRLGFRFRWGLDFRDAGLRDIWRLMWPSMIAGAAVQVNVLVNAMFASQINGARAWLNCAFRLMQFPIGVFGVAIATVTLPAVARHHAREDLAAFGGIVEQSLRLACYLTVPAAVGLFMLAPEIIGVIYQHGRFSALDTEMTAAALRAFAVGLAAYAAIKVLVPCFYALGRPKTPLRVSLVAIALNLGLNLLLVKGLGMGHVGLAASTATVALINFLQLLVFLRRDIGVGRARPWLRLLLTVGAGAVLCGLSARYATSWLASRGGDDFVSRLSALLGGIAAGAAAYLAFTRACAVPEARTLLRLAGKGAPR